MTPAKRTDDRGRAFAGSQLQTQLHVNSPDRRAAMDQRLLEALAGQVPDGATLNWVSPLSADGFVERMGAGMLQAFDLGEHAQSLKGFWPQRGPSWDALANITDGAGQPWGVLLGEGKSYVHEMLAGGPLADGANEDNARLIRSSLKATREALGLSCPLPDLWTGRLYQNANRLAHAQWLRGRGVRAFMAHLLFVDDPIKPTSQEQWQNGLDAADRDLGLDQVEVPWAVHVFLPAGTHDELVAATP